MSSMQEDFLETLSEQKLTKGDVIALLVGDGLNRVPHAATLYRQGLAPRIVIVGHDDRRHYGSFASDEMAEELKRQGVPEPAVIVRPEAGHTRAEADSVLVLAEQHGWRTILIVTSPHHQYRAFLSFLKAMHDRGLELLLINAPAPLSMTEQNPWGRRVDLAEGESRRIAMYQAKGDVASFDDGVRYLRQLRNRAG